MYVMALGLSLAIPPQNDFSLVTLATMVMIACGVVADLSSLTNRMTCHRILRNPSGSVVSMTDIFAITAQGPRNVEVVTEQIFTPLCVASGLFSAPTTQLVSHTIYPILSYHARAIYAILPQYVLIMQLAFSIQRV